MDEDNCMVDIAKFFLEFTVDESCGKCTPCRIGTQAYAGDSRSASSTARARTATSNGWRSWRSTIKSTSLCALGQTAPNPVLSTLRYFRDEYEAHVYEKRCPAHALQEAGCSSRSMPDKCKGCSACARVCPVGAISGVIKQPYVIDPTKCIKCGACIDTCKFGAIERK